MSLHLEVAIFTIITVMQGRTALMHAATCGRAHVAKLLLAKGADANTKDAQVSDHAEAYAFNYC